MMEMTGIPHLRLLVVVLCSFCVLVHASEVKLGDFTDIYGLTGCISNPTKGCGRGGTDICYSDRSNAYAISGTAPLCNACMPKGFRNIATFQVPSNLPCALWRAYGCDDYFVTNVHEKTGSNSCFSGYKSYNIQNTFSSAQEAKDTFLRQCRQRKTFADYGLPATTKLINEEDFCFPQRNNINDITIAAVGTRKATVLTNYKEYYEQKFNVVVKATGKN